MNTIHDYLKELRKALAGSDAATIQDALSDAEEYLSTALLSARESSEKADDDAVLAAAIAQYGSPVEVAAAYKEAELRLSPVYPKGKNMKNKSFITRFFGIFADPLAWGALLFVLVNLVTSIVYFTWTVAGVSLSVSFLIFIFGLFFLLFFLYSLRGVALLEGRLVEAMLGVRMPRRPLFAPKGLKWTAQLKILLKDKHSWFTMIYTLLDLPLGVFYFCLLITLITVSFVALAVPVAQYAFQLPQLQIYATPLTLPLWSMPLFVLGGFLLLTITFHLAKGIGILHAQWAKLMLVAE